MLIYSRSCEYALRALMYLVSLEDSRLATVNEISGREHLPKQFLAKLLQTLVRADLVVSVKGPHGGFALARLPEEIRLVDVVRAVDGALDLVHCAPGAMTCAQTPPCALHAQWEGLCASIEEYLEGNDLRTLHVALQRKRALLPYGPG